MTAVDISIVKILLKLQANMLLAVFQERKSYKALGFISMTNPWSLFRGMVNSKSMKGVYEAASFGILPSHKDIWGFWDGFQNGKKLMVSNLTNSINSTSRHQDQ